MLTIYTIAFGVILKARWGFSGGTKEYALMLFAGLIIYNSFSEVFIKSTTIISGNPNYVKKVVFPLELLSIVSVFAVLINSVICSIVWIAMYALIIGSPKTTVLIFPLVLLCLTPVLLGVSWLLSSLGVIFKDTSQVTIMINHSLLFLSPVFYSIEAAPIVIQKLLMINPLTYIIEQFRLVLYVGKIPALSGIVIYICISSAFACLAYKIFQRLRPSFSDVM